MLIKGWRKVKWNSYGDYSIHNINSTICTNSISDINYSIKRLDNHVLESSWVKLVFSSKYLY